MNSFAVVGPLPVSQLKIAEEANHSVGILRRRSKMEALCKEKEKSVVSVFIRTEDDWSERDSLSESNFFTLQLFHESRTSRQEASLRCSFFIRFLTTHPTQEPWE
jgi:hypothetical protein